MPIRPLCDVFLFPFSIAIHNKDIVKLCYVIINVLLIVIIDLHMVLYHIGAAEQKKKIKKSIYSVFIRKKKCREN